MCKYNIKYNILKQIKHLNLTLERLPFSFDINSFYKNEMVIKKKNRSGKRKRESQIHCSKLCRKMGNKGFIET